MQVPHQLIQSLENIKGFDKTAFEQAHANPQSITSIRTNPAKIFNFPGDWQFSKVPWSSTGFYLQERPSFTFDPLFHAGCYYVQEASSMFVEQALVQTTDVQQPLRVLDLCAAPGGKATLLQSLISKDSLLVSNEVIKSRANILKDNIIKWGSDNVLVTNNDPRDFAGLKNYFDIIVIDAPCSGSGLFRRDESAIEEWSENNVVLCSQRQQRIIADVLPALKDKGILIYSTCSFSEAEDECITDWAVASLGLRNEKLQLDASWNITEVTSPEGNTGYRFWPHLVKGEGFYLTVFRKQSYADEQVKYKPKTKIIGKADIAVIDKWMDAANHELVLFGDNIYAWPRPLWHDIDLLVQHLKVIYSGVQVGVLMRDKLVPSHALAQSSLLRSESPVTNLSYEDAIAFLQRKELSELPGTKGWQRAAYQHHALGWMNVLPNRMNNYYPKELRILKDKL